MASCAKTSVLSNNSLDPKWRIFNNKILLTCIFLVTLACPFAVHGNKRIFRVGILRHPDHAQAQTMFKMAISFVNGMGGSVELFPVYINVTATENGPADSGIFHEADELCGKLCGVSSDLDNSGLIGLLSVAPHRLVFMVAAELGLPIFSTAPLPIALSPRMSVFDRGPSLAPDKPPKGRTTTTSTTTTTTTTTLLTTSTGDGTMKTQFRTGIVRYLGPDVMIPMFAFIIRQQWLTFVYVTDGKEALDRYRVLKDRLDRWSTVATRFRVYLVCLDQLSNSPLLFHSSRYLQTEDSPVVDKFILDMPTPKKYDMILTELKDLGMGSAPYQYYIVQNAISELNLDGFEKGGAMVFGYQLVTPATPLYQSVMRQWYPSEEVPITIQQAQDNFAQLTSAEALVFDQVYYLKTLLETLSANESARSILEKPPTHLLPKCGENFAPSYCQPSFLTSIRGSNSVVEDVLSKFKADGLTGWIGFDRVGRRRGHLLNLMEVSLDTPLRTVATLRDDGEFADSSKDKQSLSRKASVVILNVTTIDSAPFLFVRNRTSSRQTTTPSSSANKRYVLNDDEFEGFCVDLADEIGRVIGVKFLFRHVADGQYGAPDPVSKTWNGMIGELIRGEAHVAIAPLTITSARERVVQMTKPILNTGISIMISRPQKQQPGVFSFLEPLSSAIWVCTLFAYCGTAVCMWILCRLNNGEMVTPFRNSFWSALCALLGLGGEFSPKSFSGRLLATVWYFFCLILISSYTANMTAFLTVERLEVPIESAEDLVRQDKISYGTVDSGSTKAFFQNSVNSLYRRMWEVMNETQPTVFVKNVKDGVEKVRSSSGRYAFLLESVMNAYHNQRWPCNTMQVGPLLDSKGYGIVTPLGSPWHADLNYAVLHLKELGIVQQLVTKWWYDKGECPQENVKQQDNISGELLLNNVSGVFFILVGGLILGIFFSILEFTVAALSLSRRTKVGFSVAARELLSGCILGSANKTIRPLHSLDLLARVLPWVEMPNFSATMLLNSLDSISPRDPRRRYIAAACMKEFGEVHRLKSRSFNSTSTSTTRQLVAVTEASQPITQSENFYAPRAVVRHFPLSSEPEAGPIPRSVTLPPLWNNGINLHNYNQNYNNFAPVNVGRTGGGGASGSSETSSSISTTTASNSKQIQIYNGRSVVRNRRGIKPVVTTSSTSSTTEEERLNREYAPNERLISLRMPETLQLRPQMIQQNSRTYYTDRQQPAGISLYELLTMPEVGTSTASQHSMSIISTIRAQDINISEEETIGQQRWYEYREHDLSNV